MSRTASATLVDIDDPKRCRSASHSVPSPPLPRALPDACRCSTTPQPQSNRTVGIRVGRDGRQCFGDHRQHQPMAAAHCAQIATRKIRAFYLCGSAAGQGAFCVNSFGDVFIVPADVGSVHYSVSCAPAYCAHHAQARRQPVVWGAFQLALVWCDRQKCRRYACVCVCVEVFTINNDLARFASNDCCNTATCLSGPLSVVSGADSRAKKQPASACGDCR